MIKGFFTILFCALYFFSFDVANAQIQLKVLIVPGHDDESWGSQYGNLKEADMNLALATKLYEILEDDGRFDVHITRNEEGYTQEFADYFENEKQNIFNFKEFAKAKMQAKIQNGNFTIKESPPHNNVNERIGIVLYGINKWANENAVDAVIHVHFNDHLRKTRWTMGRYKGFAVYMPEDQMPNAPESQKLAESIFKELKKRYTTSTYSAEKGGLVPDQKLIALGANDTLASTVRSVLIEYGYIYRFGNTSGRLQAYNTMSKLTATGIKNYFGLK